MLAKVLLAIASVVSLFVWGGITIEIIAILVRG
jgi:hypothetical protein